MYRLFYLDLEFCGRMIYNFKHSAEQELRMPGIVEGVERYVRSCPCLSVRECVSRGVGWFRQHRKNYSLHR